MTEKQATLVEDNSVGTTTPTITPVVAEGTGKTAELAGANTKTVRNAELFAAVQESKIPRWSRNSLHLYFCIFTAFCSACANGYDGSLIGSIIAMKHFQKTFGTGLAGQKISIISSLYNVGGIVCTPVAAIVSDRWGRRTGMFVGAWIIIIGSIITATSETLVQLTVGRFVLGAGIQFMTVAAPAYAVEISPPHWRGRAVGFYNCGWFGGSIPAAFVTFGCQYIDNDWSWKIPFILQCFACIIVIVAVWFIPESPRYQMANDQEDKAREFLIKYHGNGDAKSRMVLLEIEEMRDNIRQDGIDKSSWDYRPLFMTHNGRWRVAQVIMIGVFGQFSGNGLGYFNATIFSYLGVDTTAKQLGYNVLNSVLSAVGALTAVSLTDRMPRRPVLVIGTAVCALLLAINAGLTNAIANDQAAHDGKLTNLNFGRGALAFYFLFNVGFSFTYSPLQAVIPAEALETTTRAKGLALYGLVVNVFSFINTYAGPIALQNIKFKYIYVYVGWDIIESILWYFFCVESQGRTLEQLEWVYNQANPVKASQKADKVVLQADGVVSEKIVDSSA